MEFDFKIEVLEDIESYFLLHGENEYTWKEIEEKYSEKWREAVDKLANSDLPNIYFLQHINEASGDLRGTEKEWMRHKIYWEALAFVLIKRGLPRISDVKKEILIWWQDANWPGYLLMHKFVVEHKDEFVTETKESILLALEKKDWMWLYWLLEHLYKDVVPDLTEETIQKIDEVIEFMYLNETWANLMKKYGDFIKQLCR